MSRPSKAVYLSEPNIDKVESIKQYFDKYHMKPSDAEIVSSALEVYGKMILEGCTLVSHDVMENYRMLEAKDAMEKAQV